MSNSVREELAAIKQDVKDLRGDVHTILQALPPLVSDMHEQGKDIEWIKRLGSIGLGISALFSGWAAIGKGK